MASAAPPDDWRATAAAQRERTRQKIPPEWRIPETLLKSVRPVDLPRQCGILSDWELHITESRAVEIVAALRARSVTAVDVTRAFCKRAAIAHQATNCVAEVLFDEALSQAAELDAYMETHGRPKGLLHGLPVSVKEHIHMRGTRATCGLIAWADQVSDGDALMVRVLRDQGAVFHVKTTNPQTLMALETTSNLFGTTVNPHNPRLTCGGSTGGEGALIAMCGSVLGVGTDIGGSIRAPSAFCGIHGLKPSVARLPHSGLSGLHDGMQNLVGAVGPMARCVEDLELFCSTALANRPWDHEPSLIEIPWRKGEDDIQALSPPKLRIGVIWNDGVVQPHPPVTRALKEVVAALQSGGHQVIRWDTSLHGALINAADEVYFLDGGKEYRDVLDQGHEPAVPILKWLLDSKAQRQYTVQETWKLNAQIDALRTAYSKQWIETGVDVIISPVNASVASVHGEGRYWGYTSVWNALDYPAAVIPVGKVRASDTWETFPPESPASLNPLDHWFRQLYGNNVASVEGEGEGAARYADAPICIQVVGRRLQEERLLKVSGAIEGLMRRQCPSAVSEVSFPQVVSTETVLPAQPETAKSAVSVVSELEDEPVVAMAA